MLEIVQMVNDIQNMVHAIGDINIVKGFNLTDYLGLPDSKSIGGLEQYSFDYKNGNSGFVGVCENKLNQLHCETKIFNGATISEIKDVINLAGSDAMGEVVKVYEGKIRHLDSFVTQHGVRVTFISKNI